jgi:hypothetical protein
MIIWVSMPSLECDGRLHFMQDSKNFGWEINGDINFNWKTLLENKVRLNCK